MCEKCLCAGGYSGEACQYNEASCKDSSGVSTFILSCCYLDLSLAWFGLKHHGMPHDSCSTKSNFEFHYNYRDTVNRGVATSMIARLSSCATTFQLLNLIRAIIDVARDKVSSINQNFLSNFSTLYNFPLSCYAEDVVPASTGDVFVRTDTKGNFVRHAL